MKIREKIVFRYKNELDEYETIPFSIYGVVISVMNKMPELNSTNILLVDDIINIKDGYTKKIFEEKCIHHINRYYVPKGSLTCNTIKPVEKWDKLIDAINTSFYQLKRRQELYWYRILNGYRIKIPKEKDTDERTTILKALSIKDAQRALSILEKNLDREIVYQREGGAKPLYAKRNIEFISILKQGLLKDGEGVVCG